ncbi:MAG: BadF/BadG/BcrA/BcrD ATPase family protein [Granulosicoccaceae bacterium]
MSNKNLTVVVDGGGSGCRLGAFDNHGALVATAADGPASLTLGEEQAWLHISRGLSHLAEQLGEPSNWLPMALCLGLAGSLQSARRTHFLRLVPPGINPILVTDGYAQLLGATGGEPGACLAVGTGSVLHWLDKSGETDMAGGWGFPVGDEGSGAWLGFQLVNRYLWHRDTRRTGSMAPVVFQALEDRIGTDVSDVQAWSSNTRSTELASLVPIITSAAEQGDNLANKLLDRGAKQCERLLRVAPDELPVYFVGGLAKFYHSHLSSSTQQRLHVARGDAFSGLYSLSQTHQRNAT